MIQVYFESLKLIKLFFFKFNKTEKAVVPIIRVKYEKKVNPNVFETLNLYTEWLEKKMKTVKIMEHDLRDVCIFLAHCKLFHAIVSIV